MNRRHADFQSAALPTELSGQPWWRGDTECVRRCPEGKRISFQEGEIIVLKQCFDWPILPPSLSGTPFPSQQTARRELGEPGSRTDMAAEVWPVPVSTDSVIRKENPPGSCRKHQVSGETENDRGTGSTGMRSGGVWFGSTGAQRLAWRAGGRHGPASCRAARALAGCLRAGHGSHLLYWQLRHFPPERKATGPVTSSLVRRLS